MSILSSSTISIRSSRGNVEIEKLFFDSESLTSIGIGLKSLSVLFLSVLHSLSVTFFSYPTAVKYMSAMCLKIKYFY